MKKGIFVLGLAGLLFSCNNSTNTAATEFKTAYIDSSKLMTEYQEVKDIESKYKIKSEEKGKEFEGEIAQFQKKFRISNLMQLRKDRLGLNKRAASYNAKNNNCK